MWYLGHKCLKARQRPSVALKTALGEFLPPFGSSLNLALDMFLFFLYSSNNNNIS